MTQEQFETLSRWEKNFDTALRGNWALNPGYSACKDINAIIRPGKMLNYNCGNCVLDLLKEAGEVYFKEKAKRAEISEVKTKEVKEVKKPRKAKNTKSE